MRTSLPLLVRLLLALSCLAFLPEHALAQSAGEWPGFRGRTGSGTVADRVDPEGLAPTVLWRAPVGIGYSGVTVADGKAITMFEDGDQYMVAFDADTGAELWRHRVDAPYPGRDGSWNGPISTPVARGNLVVGLTPWGRLFALDAADGEPVWEVHLTEDLGAPRPLYGFASSPLVVGDTLVVHGGPEAGSVLGLDVDTGEVRWRVGLEVVDAPSPVTLTLAGREMVVAAGVDNVFGIDAGSGEVLWQYAHEGRGYRGQGSLVPVGLGEDRIFLAHDNDASQVIGVRAEGDAMVAEQLWLERTIRNSYTVAVHHEGHIYAYSARILVCVDAATGELKWRSREPGDGFITLMGDSLIILTKDGTLHVVKASPEGYEELASGIVFDELTWTPVSIAYGDVFTRSLDEVVRVDLHGGATVAPRVADANYNVNRSLEPGDGPFGRFIRQVEAAVAAGTDPAPLIDAFFAAHPVLPLIEGEDLVHFVYRGPDEVMAIAGDHIGSRQEAPMVRVGDTDLFYYTARLLPEARVSYVFRRETEAIRDPYNPLQTATLMYDADREFNTTDTPLPQSEVQMPQWREPAHVRDPDPATRGTLETLTVDDEELGEVSFTVYLPHGYADSTARYPVVYHHGPAPREISRLPWILDNLIAGGMPPAIVVFSEGFLPPIPPYFEMWASQLVPAMDERYRTIAGAEGRVHYGTEIGTIHAAHIAFRYPGMSSGLAMQTMVFLDTDWDELVEVLLPATDNPLRMYIDWGAYSAHNPQEAWDSRRDSAKFRGEFEKLGFEVAGGEVPDGDGWRAWSQRVDAVLRAILPAKE